MPLRILRKSKQQYNVVSKSAFVISVELLDNGVMDVSLDADSTGRDCLLNISQRLGLHQPEFFGLRYISRGVPPRQRWVDADRPLRKQLEKYSQDSQLSLGVMFYVNDVNLLKDEMTRYHYFLQLKSDVIDGKLNCSIDQAISLAAYSLCAEFGDFDQIRHTVEYLRDFAILPKELIVEQKFSQLNVDALYEAVVRQYASLIGFPPPLGEIYYIMVAQQLDGYGQEEPYPAKDDSGNDILICISAYGLIIRRRDWTHIAAFRWMDIKSLLGHKRLFVVESSQSHRTMQYHFTDAEVAKYVRKICLLQSTFYKENIQQPVNSQSSHHQQQPNYAGINSQIHQQQQQQQQMMMMNRNLNINNLGDGGNNSGVYFPVTPDLLAMSSSASSTTNILPGSANSTYMSNNTSSSFNQSGLSLNSSSASNFNINQNMVNFNQQQATGASGGMMLPIIHPFQIQSFPNPQQQIEPLMFHQSGELYNQMMPTVRTNPLAQHEDQEYSNGYGRAVSDYTAALQQKYGNVIPDLSSRKSSSQLYFSSGDRSRSQSQTLAQIRASLEEEPIYQNEIVSQIHSIELRDSISKSNSASDVNSSASNLNSSATALASSSSETHHKQQTPSPSMMLKKQILNENPYDDVSSFSSPSSMNFHHLHSQPLTTTHPPIQLFDESPPVYAFNNFQKPPPPAYHLHLGGLSSNSNSALASGLTIQQQSRTSLNSSTSSSVTSLPTNTKGSGGIEVETSTVPAGEQLLQLPVIDIDAKNEDDRSVLTAAVTVSQLSPSATSSVVSAQIHCEPSSTVTQQLESNAEEQKETEVEQLQKSPQKEDESSNSIVIVNDDNVSLTDEQIIHNNSSTSNSSAGPELSSANSSSIISTCVDDIVDSPKASTSTFNTNNATPDKSNNRIEDRFMVTTTTTTNPVHIKSVNKAGPLFAGKPIDPAILREFQAIPKTKNNPSFATALKRENSKRNRTPDIVPYEDNALRLSPTRQNPSGYINASPVSVKIGDRSWLYIVGQLPGNACLPEFWQLIWESEVKVIVSLEKDPSAFFYPQKGTTLTFNDFQVTESKSERRNSSSSLAISREFNLIYNSKKKQRKVWVLPYEDEWRDDVPIHTEHFLCFLEEVNSIQRKVSDPTTPLTVMCGTGAGRSGVLILADLLLHSADCGHKLRCDELLKELRNQRMALVSTPSQYAFVLHTLSKYLAQSRLI